MDEGISWSRIGRLLSSQSRGSTSLNSNLAGVDTVKIGSKLISANDLRSVKVINLQNKAVTIDSVLGKAETSIVVYLQSWLAAKSTLTEKLGPAVVGPIFISIGNSDQLQIFREKFPELDDKQLYVDDSESSDSYTAIGFDKMFRDMELTKKGNTQFWKNLNLSKELMDEYVASVKEVSPKFDIWKLRVGLAKVSQLGGTIGIRNNRIVYVYQDGVPGDYPKPVDVIEAMLSS